MLENLEKYKIILASNSPRRKELLSGLGIKYEVKTLPGIEETYPDTLKAVFLLIDIRHAPSENDRIMYQWIVDQGFHPIIIATKLDKIKRSQVQKQMKVLREGLKLIPGTTIIPFSSQTKQGRDEIWDMVENQFLNQ